MKMPEDFQTRLKLGSGNKASQACLLVVAVTTRRQVRQEQELRQVTAVAWAVETRAWEVAVK